ncbi:acetyl-CoA carboxylase biotin carboxyl carrier protein [Acholeplasma hippikon]|uniref:Biotin carboxyl carrier protein of acetyl-CoA carboxylase n=1 Tax=Acholeplasma hippikon TaxID=264636 RepID=A0A449BI77_9MOLU|nr:biotin/lipoyl-containing protein [Acholeplasma hippikon]VEU82156.1 Biotin carboxyl carrier protein of acetyl-CoA carboxylase [Acholeplasma hippikon]
MKINEIKSIIKDFENSNLQVLEFESNDVKLKLSKNKNEEVTRLNEPQAHKEVKEVVSLSEIKEPNLPKSVIKSPLVGTFYESSTPNGKPFVSVGQEVKKGQVVCIVEAMKIMNEITSPVDGKIESVNFKNGDVIGFNDALFTLV